MVFGIPSTEMLTLRSRRDTGSSTSSDDSPFLSPRSEQATDPFPQLLRRVPKKLGGDSISVASNTSQSTMTDMSTEHRSWTPRIDQPHVDARLKSIRLLPVGGVLLRLRRICSHISVVRFARSSGILTRLVLNSFVAFLQLMRRGKINTWRQKALRALLVSESVYLMSSLGVASAKLLPWDIFRTGSSRCRRASEAADMVRQLANYSVLSHIPRIRNVLPGLWSHYVMESAVLRSYEGHPFWGVLMGVSSSFRVCSFLIVEVSASVLGLVGLDQKLQDMAGLRSGLIEFLGFANQITGIVDREELCMVTVLRVIFAGEDAQFGDLELEAMREFNGYIMRGLYQQHGLWKSTILYLSLTSEDFQRLVIFDDSSNEFHPPLHGNNNEQSSRWWLNGGHQQMLLGKFILAFDRLFWQESTTVASVRAPRVSTPAMVISPNVSRPDDMCGSSATSVHSDFE